MLTVLILIVVEHALGAKPYSKSRYFVVLILIVVEHALGVRLSMFQNSKVLILIVVEHALGVPLKTTQTV